jgi:hypothetical protein
MQFACSLFRLLGATLKIGKFTPISSAKIHSLMLSRYQMNASCVTETLMTFQRTMLSAVYTAPELSTEIRVRGRTLPAQMVCIAIDACLMVGGSEW